MRSAVSISRSKDPSARSVVWRSSFQPLRLVAKSATQGTAARPMIFYGCASWDTSVSVYGRTTVGRVSIG